MGSACVSMQLGSQAYTVARGVSSGSDKSPWF